MKAPISLLAMALAVSSCGLQNFPSETRTGIREAGEAAGKGLAAIDIGDFRGSREAHEAKTRENERLKNQLANSEAYARAEKEKAAKLTKYNLTFRTSSRDAAGTGSDVFVVLTGENGRTSEPLVIKPSSGSGSFSRASMKTCTFECPKLGKIIKLEVGIVDGSGHRAGWALDSVTVTDTQTGQSSTFNANRWFSASQGLSTTLDAVN